MTYDKDNARFVCNVPLLEETDYYYYFLVDGVKVMDAFNAKTGVADGEEFSMIRNRTYNVEMSASILNSEMDYNDNNLLTVNWAPKNGSSLDGFEVKEFYADLSELGLGKVAIDKEVKALSITEWLCLLAVASSQLILHEIIVLIKRLTSIGKNPPPSTHVSA